MRSRGKTAGSRAPRLVLTGFRAFPGVPENPTQALVEHLQQAPHGLPQPSRLALLDVDYSTAGAALDALLDPAPDALLLTGYSGSATAITLEAQATSRCAPDKGDIFGFVPAPDADPAPPLCTAVDLAALCRSLADAGLSAEISEDAGGYLCNFSYRHALQRIAEGGWGTRVLFVHLPALEGTELAANAAATISWKDALRALEIIAAQLTR